MGLHPLRLLFPNSNIEAPKGVVSGISSHELCNKLFRDFYSDLSSLHKDYVEAQKKMFDGLKKLDKYDDAKSRLYDTLTTKFLVFTNRVYDSLNNTIDKSIGAIIRNIKDNDTRIGLIKEHINRHNSFGNNTVAIEYGDIGYKTISFPKPEEFAFLAKDMNMAFDPDKPVTLPTRLSKEETLPNWISDSKSLEKKIASEFEPEFKLHHKYTIDDIIGRYNSFKKEAIAELKKRKEEYNLIQEFSKNIHEKCSKMKANVLDTALKNGDEEKIKVYSYNAAYISNFMEKLVGLCSMHYRYTLKMVVESMKAYSFTVESIYEMMTKELKASTVHVNEAKLTAADRRAIPDSDYGIPSLKKYPMPDKEHVLSAIRLSGHCPKGYEAELARNVERKMKEYGIPISVIGENNKLYKYIHKTEGNAS